MSIGLIGTTAFNSAGAKGLFYGGGFAQLGRQALCSGIVTVWSFGIALLLGFIIEKTIGFRTSAEVEVSGIDIAEHAESAYELSPSTGGGAFTLAGVGAAVPTAPKAPAAEPDEVEALDKVEAPADVEAPDDVEAPEPEKVAG